MTDLEKLKYIKTSLEQQCMLAIQSTSVIEDRLDIEKTYCSQIQTFENAIFALEKQIPKKVKYLNRHGSGSDLYNKDYFNCPSCGRRLRNKQKDNHCGKCGQALDWSND